MKVVWNLQYNMLEFGYIPFFYFLNETEMNMNVKSLDCFSAAL